MDKFAERLIFDAIKGIFSCSLYIIPLDIFTDVLPGTEKVETKEERGKKAIIMGKKSEVY